MASLGVNVKIMSLKLYGDELINLNKSSLNENSYNVQFYGTCLRQVLIYLVASICDSVELP